MTLSSMDYPVRPDALQRINADLPPGDRNPGDFDDGRRYVRSDPFSHIVRTVLSSAMASRLSFFSKASCFSFRLSFLSLFPF